MASSSARQSRPSSVRSSTRSRRAPPRHGLCAFAPLCPRVYAAADWITVCGVYLFAFGIHSLGQTPCSRLSSLREPHSADLFLQSDAHVLLCLDYTRQGLGSSRAVSLFAKFPHAPKKSYQKPTSSVWMESLPVVEGSKRLPQAKMLFQVGSSTNSIIRIAR